MKECANDVLQMKWMINFILYCDKFDERRQILLKHAEEKIPGFYILSTDFKLYCLLTFPDIVSKTANFLI